MRWTDEEFKRVAANTRLKENTVAACREVLVLGATGSEAGARHGVRGPHVSRAITVLTEKREELRGIDEENAKALETMNVADVASKATALLKAAAIEAARSIKGQGWIIRDAKPGQIYEGAGVVKIGQYLVQDIGRVGIIHDMRNLAQEPEIGHRLEIMYSAKGKKAILGVIPPDRGTRARSR